MVCRLLLLLLLPVLSVASAAPQVPDVGEETDGFLPKDTLGVTAFRKEHPEADGREILVAVLDTGLDLLHPALQRTPDGQRKIVDFYDATDAGLVDTSTRARVERGSLVGLSGRRLRARSEMPEEVRIGLVRADEIYPRGLLRRLRRERKREHEKAKRLAQDRSAAVPEAPRDPVHDLAVWKSGDAWRVVVDTDEDGDLADETVLRPYGVAQEVAELAPRTRLGFGVDVRREGEAVSLLFDGGGHGTHVAGIIAGWYDEDSPLNGLAPGARLLAAKIGNGRYGGPTTHLALIRGLEWAGRRGADVVNISFGGPSLYRDGREVSARFVNEAVERYGFAVCLSAGNSGPALTTIGSPAVARRAISVGAWCPRMTQTTNYGVVAPAAGRLFAFSSRGPLPDGSPGLDLIAPGAAVSPVPAWSLVAGRNMNGTSMAAPQTSGALAVLLSAARQADLPVTWRRLSAAIRRGARPVPGLTAVEQGHGLLDVGAAFEVLRTLSAEPVEWIAAGYLDRAGIATTPFPVELRLGPDWPEKAAAEERSRFQRVVRLEPDVPWLTVASPIHVSADGATVRARADPERMVPGLNVGVLRVVDVGSATEVGRHVVTAIRPRSVPRCGAWIRDEVTLGPGERRSLFLRVPPGATTVRVETSETAREGGTRLAFRNPDRTSREKAAPESTPPEPGRTSVHHRSVHEGSTLEIVLHRPFQAPPGSSRVEIGLCFRGLSSPEEMVRIPSGRFGSHLNLRAGGDVNGRFEARLDWEEEPFRLSWSTTADPDGPLLLGEETVFVHEGRGAFRVEADRREVRFDLGFESPMADYLDDSVYRIEDANGRVVARGHIWRGPFSFRPPHRGRFVLAITTWERGRRFHRDGRLFSPVLLRRIPSRGAEVKHDVYDGLVPGGPSGRRFTFADGERRSVLVLRPKGEGRRRGTIRFVDDAWGTPLLERPLRVEADPADDPDRARRDDLVATLTAGLDDALERDEVGEEERSRLDTLAAMVRGAGDLSAETEARGLLLRARAGTEAATAALPRLGELVESARGKAAEAVLRARAEVRLLAGDADGAEEDLRGDQEDALRIRALVARQRGKSAEALKHLDRWRGTAPPRPSMARLRIELLTDLGRHAEARRALLDWTKRFPDRRAEVAPLAVAIETAAEAASDGD